MLTTERMDRSPEFVYSYEAPEVEPNTQGESKDDTFTNITYSIDVAGIDF